MGSITPEPKLMPGYTGHCPQLCFREGKTYGKLSHKLLLDPCARHAEELVVTLLPNEPLKATNVDRHVPSPKQIKILSKREKFIDSIYRYPIIPGYDGHVPNLSNKIGLSITAAATSGSAEFETLMEDRRCEQRNLQNHDLLESGQGHFDFKVVQRILPTTKYRSPLIEVKPRYQALADGCIKSKTENENKLPYSKFTVPHFMEDDNVEKYIIKGYAGHIPLAMMRIGESSKQLTKNALCEYTNQYRHRLSAEWCPVESVGVGTTAANTSQFTIYHRTVGMIPNYSGHVPGEAFKIGETFTNATVDARRWLALHKD